MNNATSKQNKNLIIKKLQEQNQQLKYLVRQTAIIAGHYRVRNTPEKTLKIMFPEETPETEPYKKLIIEMIETIQEEAKAIRSEIKRNKTL